MEQDSLPSMAPRAPARACQPPPLLMDSATCSADTRCSALAGLVPGCRPSTRQSAPPPLAGLGRLGGTISRVLGQGSQTQTVRSGSPAGKCQVSTGSTTFPHSGPISGLITGFPLFLSQAHPQLLSFTSAFYRRQAPNLGSGESVQPDCGKPSHGQGGIAGYLPPLVKLSRQLELSRT